MTVSGDEERAAPGRTMVAAEIAWWLLLLLLYVPALAAGVTVGRIMPGPVAVSVVPGLVTGVVTLLLTARVVRLFLPSLRPGRYGPKSTMRLVWGLHFLLSRLVFLGPLLPFLHYSSLLRWLAWRALGGRVAFGSSMSSDITIPDVSLMTVGAGSILGSRTALRTHAMDHESLWCGSITIGRNVLVGGDCGIGPETVIGDGTRLHYRVSLWGQTRIGRNVRIGKDAEVEEQCDIGDGAVVEDRTRVPRGTVIPAGGRWRGVPTGIGALAAKEPPPLPDAMTTP